MRSELAVGTQAGYLWLVVAAAAPFLLFPNISPPLTLIALLVIAAFHARRWIRGGSLALNTPLGLPLVVLAVMALIGFVVSPSADARPKVFGILLGMLVFRAVLDYCRVRVHEWRCLIVYLSVGAAFVTAGLLTMSEPVIKWKVTGAITAALPGILFRPTGAEFGVNPNALGVTTLFFVPVLVVTTIALRSTPLKVLVSQRTSVVGARGSVYGLARMLSVGALLAFASVLVLTQSRAALIGAAAATFLVLLMSGDRVSRFLSVGMLAVVVGSGLFIDARGGWPSVLADSRSALPDSFGGVERRNPIPLTTRAAIWGRALRSVKDTPVVGLGLSGFREAVKSPYPGYMAVSDYAGVAHAHNTFLQVALDVGLPGLVAYVAIFMLASLMCWQIQQRGSPVDSALALGLWGSLAAVHIFGLFDAVALGAKVGLFMWWSLGLIAAVHRRVVVLAATRPVGTAWLPATQAAEGAIGSEG
jgi:putative inorganic carbon (HCO3(-)) transporter